METTIHDIKKIEIEKIELNSTYCVRTIRIKSEKEELVLKLFGEEKELVINIDVQQSV